VPQQQQQQQQQQQHQQQQIQAISDQQYVVKQQQQAQLAHEQLMQQQHQTYSDQQYHNQQQLFHQQYQQYQQQQSKEFRQMSDFPVCPPPYSGQPDFNPLHHPNPNHQQWPIHCQSPVSPMPLDAFFHREQPPPYESYAPSPTNPLSPPSDHSFNPSFPSLMVPAPSNLVGDDTEIESGCYVYKENNSVAMSGLDDKGKEKHVGFELPSN
jgi:hypothetical protein